MYKFKLSNGIDERWVKPIYGDGQSIKYAKPSGEEFLQETLNFEMLFMKSDFDFINNSSFESEFIIKIIEGQTPIYVAKFTKMDCEFEESNIKVKPILITPYTDLLPKLSKKHKIETLGLTPINVEYDKRPLVQVYVPGSSYITNIIGASVWTEQVSPVSDYLTLQNLLFRTNPLNKRSFVTGVNENLTENVSGEYTQVGATYLNGVWLGDYIFPMNNIYRVLRIEHGTTQIPRVVSMIVRSNINTMDDIKDINSKWSINGNIHTFIGVKFVDNAYSLFFVDGDNSSLPSSGTLTHVSGGINTTPISGNINSGTSHKIVKWVIYKYLVSGGEEERVVYATETDVIDHNQEYTDTFSDKIYHSVEYDEKVNIIDNAYWMRVWSDVNVFGDMVDINGTSDEANNYRGADKLMSKPPYKYARGITYDGFKYFDEYQDEDSYFGRIKDDAAFGQGKYFKEYEESGKQWIPIQQNRWDYVSTWMNWSQFFIDFTVDGSIKLTLHDGYRLHNLINSLLSKIDTNFNFTNNIVHSKFLYNDDNVIGLKGSELIYTPKSNVIRFNYTEAAKKTEISLQDVFEFMKVTHNVYWHMNGNDLVLEHISYYDNGRSYITTINGMDLTKLKDPKMKRLWGFGQGSYKYNKQDIAESISFKWMDEVSFPFTGFDIDNKSIYIKEGNFVTKSAGQISTDIDILTNRGDSLSLDGGVFLVIKDGKIEYEQISLSDNKTWNLQNGKLSFVYLHNEYHLHHMDTMKANVNGEDIIATTVKRSKEQNISLPITNVDIIGLIKTDLGKGNIKSLELDLGTKFAKIIILHDN